MTQFGRALAELNIEISGLHSISLCSVNRR